VKKGDIILVPFPFTDLTELKTRPALVLISTELDVTVSFITSQLKWQESNDLRIEPDELNGLKKPSLIRLSKLATIEKKLVIGKLRMLIDSGLKQVNQELIKLFDLY